MRQRVSRILVEDVDGGLLRDRDFGEREVIAEDSPEALATAASLPLQRLPARVVKGDRGAGDQVEENGGGGEVGADARPLPWEP